MGALVGAGLGALIGHSAHRSSNVQKQQEATLEQGFSEFPALTRPKLRSIWVPDRIEGNKYIKGHFIYVIEDGASWSR